MRRHVQSVNRRRRNLGIAPCCCQRAVGQHWVVVSMDDVMSHPRMIGQLSEDFFQDRASFLLFGVAGVSRRRETPATPNRRKLARSWKKSSLRSEEHTAELQSR